MTRKKPDPSEIHQRLDEQIELAGWLQRAAMPHDETLAGAALQLAVLAMALTTHVGKLREIRSAWFGLDQPLVTKCRRHAV
jgi:hypothetical protein